MRYFFALLLFPVLIFGAQKIDNLVIDGNSIKSANSNGDIVLDPDGTGAINMPDLTADRVPYIDGSNNIASSAVTSTELGYLSGVTSAIQTQLNSLATAVSPSTDDAIVRFDGTSGAFQDSSVIISDTNAVSGITEIDVDNIKIDGNTISSTDTDGDIVLDPNGTGGIQFSDLTADTVPYIDANKEIVSSTVTPTELGYLSGVTSSIQSQFSNYVEKSGDTMTGALNLDNENALQFSESDANGANYVSLQAPADLSSDYSYTLPSDYGSSGEFLQTDGLGGLTWAASGSGKVNGPLSSTDNAITRWDGVDGSTIQDSNVLIDDSDVMTGVSQLSLGGSGLYNSSIHGIEIEDDGGSEYSYHLGLREHATGNGPTAAFYRSRGTAASPTVVQDNDLLGKFDFLVRGSAAWELGASLGVYVDGTVGTGVPTEMSFSTRDSAGNSLEALKLGADQSVNLPSQNNLRLYESDNTNYIGFQAPSSVTSDVTFTLPDGDGTTDQYLKTDGSGNLSWDTPAGGGGGDGSKNYFDTEDSKFEGGTVGGWADAGTGSANLTESTTSTANQILAGTYSLKLHKSAHDGSGQWFDVDLNTIDRADQGRILFGSFEFDASKDADYSSGDLKIGVYDNDNSSYLYCGSAEELEIPATKGKMTFACHLEESTTDINFRLLVNSTNSAEYHVYFDDFKFGPAAQVNTVYRKSQTIDLASSNNFTDGAIEVVRVGQIVTINVTEAITYSSTSGATSAAGVLPDWARPESNTVRDVTNASGSAVYLIDITTAGTINISSYDWTGSLTNTTTMNRGSINYTVPDTTGPTLTENELSLQTSFVSVYNSATQTVNSATTTAYEFDTIAKAKGGALTANTSSNNITVNKAGSYRVTLTHRIGNLNADKFMQVVIRINGSNRAVADTFGIDGIYDPYATASKTFDLEKGDVISGVVYHDHGASRGFSGGEAFNTLTVESLPDYTVLGAVKERNRVQTKILSADTSTEAFISEIGFSNLVIGKWYTMKTQITYLGGERYGSFTIFHDGDTIARIWNKVTSGGNGDRWTGEMSATFKATATTVSVDAPALDGGTVEGNGTLVETWSQIEERNDLIETSDF